MLCISMKEKKNDFPLYISNIHMCTISLIIYNKQFCNKFLPPLHFLYIVDDIKDRCVPRSFTIVIFGRQEKKKKKKRERDTFYSQFSNVSLISNEYWRHGVYDLRANVDTEGDIVHFYYYFRGQ